MKKILIGIAILMALPSAAQTAREEILADVNKAGSVYYAYPVTESHNTPAPEGYKPFYISHYGRHGSRYLISSNDYYWVSDALHKANEAGALTPLGKNVMERLDTVLLEAAERGGDLSPLGVRQHRGIAERMYAAYPEVFEGETPISARSTVVIRCVLSMDAFCERLKELNPNLKITRESSQRYMPYLNYHSPESDEWRKKEWRIEGDKFKSQMTNDDRMMELLFNDPDYVRRNINPIDLTWGLFYIAVGMQDIETPISFYDLFTPEELFNLWQAFNFDFYAGSGNYPLNKGMQFDNAKYLLNNIIVSADEALAGENPTATLRFGHDTNLMPLAGILEFPAMMGQTENPEEIYKVFADYKVSPMAGNVQLIFFKNPDDPKAPVLVKFMLNEEEQEIPVKTDNWPFYKWNDVRKYYSKKTSGIK